MNSIKLSVRMFLVLFTLLSAGSFSAEQNGLIANKNGQVTEDLYVAGGTAQFLADVEGDAVAAGGIVNIVNAVSEDVLVAGGMVNITGNIGDDIRAAGGLVAIVGEVRGDAIIAGGSVILESGSTVGGRAWLVGRTVTVAGNVKGNLKATGEEIILAGTIGGDVELDAESITIEPDAVIRGNLTYSAPREAVFHKDAVIEGAVDWRESEFGDFDAGEAGFAGTLVYFLSLAISAIVLYVIYPRLSLAVVQEVQDVPLKALGIGLLILVVTPFVILMLLVSILGIPLGLILLALYVVTLISGLLVGIIWIGDVVFRRLGKVPDESKWIRAGSIVAAATLMLVIGLIPFIGSLVFFAVLLLGAGAVQRIIFRLYVGRNDRLALS